MSIKQILQKYITSECAAVPATLFDGISFRKTQKSKLYEIYTPITDNIPYTRNKNYAIDGGFLLHKVKWHSYETFLEIRKKYTEYLAKYAPCTVVFDGYPIDATLKSYERTRRATKHHSSDVDLSLIHI